MPTCIVLVLTVLAGPLASANLNYFYDGAGHLVGVNNGTAGAIVYAYDPAGNLITRQVLPAGTPYLAIAKTHSGTFAAGQTGVTYTLNVTNIGTGPSNGTVSVTDTLPTGLTATSIAGDGWTCTQPIGPCTRSGVQSVGVSYPAITVTVNVSTNPPAQVINQASVSGGGSATSSTSDTATLSVGVAAPPPIHPNDFTGDGAVWARSCTIPPGPVLHRAEQWQRHVFVHAQPLHSRL